MLATSTRVDGAAIDLQAQVNLLGRADNITSLFFLAREYVCIFVIVSCAISFAELRGHWGLSFGWDVPVFIVAIVLVGGLQHRLAGLGHEAAHYSLFRNKIANDLMGDLFCMFPILTCVHLYRLFHFAHHEYTNDPEQDPDLVNLGLSKRIAEFPMPHLRFVLTNYLRWLTDPVSLLRYQWAYLYVNTFGKGNNVYMRRLPYGDAHMWRLRTGTLLGLVLLVGYAALTWLLTRSGLASWLLVAAFSAFAAAGLTIRLIPESWLYRSPLRQPYSVRMASFVRITFYVVVLTTLAYTGVLTDGRSALYTFWLWLVPLGTSFTYFMLLRDVYQHTNADNGRFTNSRVFFPDYFTRWAIFVYGQDIHVTHHLYPVVPHYRLMKLHRLLQQTDAKYRAMVVECHGTFLRRGNHPTILDVLSQPAPGDHKEAARMSPVGA